MASPLQTYQCWNLAPSTSSCFPSLSATLSSSSSGYLSFNCKKHITYPSWSFSSSLSVPSPRPLCLPPRGKYVREDYLVKKVSAQELQDLVRGDRTAPIVVDFYATWCGPCILMAQELEMLAVEYETNAIIVKIDTDEEYEFARDMQVRGLPTLFFISPDPSKEAIRTEGLIPLQMMRDLLDNHM